MLGLGTQELRPWGPKHQATDNDVLYLSLSSKSIRALGGEEKWLYHSCPSGYSFFLPNPQTQTDRALRDAAKITRCSFGNIATKWLTLQDVIFIFCIFFYCLNQSVHILTRKISSQQKCRQFWLRVKCVWKPVICYSSSVYRDDKCAHLVRNAIDVIAKFYIWVGRTHFSLTLPLSFIEFLKQDQIGICHNCLSIFNV